jgi:hypothetical protein
VWFGSILCLLYIFALVYQLIFDGNLAVWIEDDKIIYLNSRYFLVHLNDIERLNLGSCGRFNSPAIVFHLHNGGEKAIPLKLLGESGEAVVERLRGVNLCRPRAR